MEQQQNVPLDKSKFSKGERVYEDKLITVLQFYQADETAVDLEF